MRRENSRCSATTGEMDGNEAYGNAIPFERAREIRLKRPWTRVYHTEVLETSVMSNFRRKRLNGYGDGLRIRSIRPVISLASSWWPAVRSRA